MRENRKRLISKRRKKGACESETVHIQTALDGRRVLWDLTLSLMRDHRLPQLSRISQLRKTLPFSIEDLGRSFSLLTPQYKRQHPPPFTSLLQLKFTECKKSLNLHCSSSSPLSSSKGRFIFRSRNIPHFAHSPTTKPNHRFNPSCLRCLHVPHN